MPIRLSKAAIAALKPRDTAYLVFDSEVRRLAVRVSPAGARSWTFEYRPGGGRRSQVRRVTLGRVEELTPDAARRKAKNLQARVLLGGDPAQERDDERSAATVTELGERFLAEEITPKRKRRTAELYEVYLRRHILPAIGTRRARDVTHADIAKLHRRIAAGGHQVTANRVVTFASGLFTWAAKMGEIPKGANPATDIERFREEGRERFLSDEEIRRVGATLALAETAGLPFEIDETNPKAKHAPKSGRTVISAHATNAIRLLLLTGCRLREVLHLRWQDVDLAHALFTITDGKTGRRAVWLNAPSLAVLDALEQIRIGDYVIAGEDPAKPRADLQKPWRQIVRHAELDGVTLHTLRHTHATVGVGAGLGLPLIGSLLGDRQSSTTAKYAHIAASPARRASEAIGAALAAAMGQSSSGEVLPLRTRRRRP